MPCVPMSNNRTVMSFVKLTFFVVVVWFRLLLGCRISEFYCDNGECVGLDRFCDGIRDCEDGSDETRFCSRCNRTYYGDRHKTYHIDIAKPSAAKLPYICALTFKAGGGDLGDLVELSFERFNVGHLSSSSSSSNGVATSQCTGSYMQILERNMYTDTAGRWCGSTPLIPVYYSEDKNVTVVLTVVSVSDDLVTPFQFSLKFRYLSKSDAVTRYGHNQFQYHRGEWVPSSICDRIFQDCDSQPCKIHSPNFPGLYPRNVTCLFHITQRTIPRGKHAFVVLQQPNEDKLSIKADSNLIGSTRDIAFRPEKKLMFGADCTHDYLTVYDGSDTRSPVLAKFCHSGALPPIVSSGPEVVVVFQTAAVDLLELHSFELDVEVLFLPENDVGLRTVGQRCEWLLAADEKRSGIIHSLRHLAAPNTSCSYSFRGRRHDIVWLYFVKYFVDSQAGTERSFHEVTVRGDLYDGNPVRRTNNTTLLATFDDDNSLKLCVHARNFPNFVPLRPCRYPGESYLSTGSDLFLQYNFSNRFSLHYLHMEGRYEFVDTFQDGEPADPISQPSSTGCNRLFRSVRRPEGTFTSPRNVFLYGRGGRSSLRCSFSFIGQESETVRISFRRFRMGNRKCDTLYDSQARRYVCYNQGTQSGSSSESNDQSNLRRLPVAEIRVSQVLWNRIEVPMACICHLDHTLTIDLMSNVVHVNLTITDMTSLEDFDSFYFEAHYEFLSSVHCKATDYMLDGNGGEVTVTAERADLRDGPTRTKCPWLLLADFNQFVHLRILGVSSTDVCDTNNRVAVFSAEELEPIAVVCPMVRRSDSGIPAAAATGSLGVAYGASVGGGGVPGVGLGLSEVEVYTKSWNKTVIPSRLNSNTLIVEFYAGEPGRFYFKWTRGVKSHAKLLLGRKSRSEECAAMCTDRDGCSPAAIFFCEKKAECSEQGNGGNRDGCPVTAQFPWLYVGIGVGCGVLVAMLLVVSLLQRRRETKAKKGKPVPTDEYAMDSKEIDC